jgi:hypothetical protein
VRRVAGVLLAALALSTLVGCLIWPFPTGDLLSGRGRITKQYAAPLQVGTATREEVLLRLGEPDAVLEGGRVFIYRWTEVRGFFAAVGNGGNALVIPFPGYRSVRLEFGPDARLVRMEFIRGEQNPGGEGAPAKSVPT